MTTLQAQTELLTRIRSIWESARTQAARSVNTAHVCANWLIGQQIVEAEQGGAKRAGYGKALLKTLSEQLSGEYGDGFSVSALQYMRGFFLGYPELVAKHHALRVEFDTPQIQHAVRGESGGDGAWRSGLLHSGLSWTHYRTLLKVERRVVRDFYEIEASRCGWSARQLERQINSFLFERLAKSRDKKGVLALANKGQAMLRPQDVIKDPYVLEFLDLPESHRLVESRIEEALITFLPAATSSPCPARLICAPRFGASWIRLNRAFPIVLLKAQRVSRTYKLPKPQAARASAQRSRPPSAKPRE